MEGVQIKSVVQWHIAIVVYIYLYLREDAYICDFFFLPVSSLYLYTPTRLLY